MSLIASYAMLPVREIKSILSNNPDVLRAYNARVEDILDTIRKFGANHLILTQVYSVDRYVVDAWLTEDPRLQQAAHDFYESLVDVALNGLLVALQRQDPWAILHVLRSSRGAARGFGEKIQIDIESEAKRYNINLDATIADMARYLVEHDKGLVDDDE